MKARLLTVLSVFSLAVPRAEPLHAQTMQLVATFTTSPTLAAPTVAQLDVATGTSAFSSTSSVNFKFVTTCTGGGSADCTIRIQRAASAVLDLQYAVVSSSNCAGLTAASGTWIDVPTSATAIAFPAKNSNCQAEFAFRAKNLSYAVHKSPGTLAQGIQFSITRP